MQWILVSLVIAALVAGAGGLAVPFVFAERVAPGVMLGDVSLGGASETDIAGLLGTYEEQLLSRQIDLRLGATEVTHTISELGFELDEKGTTQALLSVDWPRVRSAQPVLKLDEARAREVLHGDFAAQLDLPQNASLVEKNSRFALVPSAPGEQVNMGSLKDDALQRITSGSAAPIDVVIVSAAAPVQDSEVLQVQSLADRLLQDGFTLRFEDQEFPLKAFTIRRLLKFVEQVDPANPANTVLGVQFDPEELRAFLTTTIEPEVNQEAVNARFEISQDPSVPDAPTDDEVLTLAGQVQGIRVDQFAVPQRGQTLNIDKTMQQIAVALDSARIEAGLVIDIVEPDVAEAGDIQALGITDLLATGESDFAGSPANRIHNIGVGASRYHGLLIGPGTEFSFNQFLGPVDAEAGFKPELVIKTNVTVPEFGGGLCQVSTTAFRAAVYSGLEITQRRNHSYAVAYYGTPGFDSTIYPPYTDLRFLNNTPGYILIQTRIEGTKLFFEFWGTDDGREVTVDGPHPYNRQPDGSVKATLQQTVAKDGAVLVEDTFYSNYKSPKLFPKVLSANGEAPPGPDSTPNTPPTNEPATDKPPVTAPTATPTANPAAQDKNKQP